MNNYDYKSHHRRSGNIIWGVILIGMGTLFLLMNLDILPDMSDMWPVVIIIVGLALTIGAFVRKDKMTAEQPHGDYPGQQ